MNVFNRLVLQLALGVVSRAANSALSSAINRLDRYHLLIPDDLAYAGKDQAETSILFELISARYERRFTLITANQPFGAWGTVFPDPAMTLAAQWTGSSTMQRSSKSTATALPT